MTSLPLVSIIIPAYHCEKTVSQTLSAVFGQTYQNIEVIVVDDGSVDATAAEIKKFPKATYIFQDNAGPAAARNRGAKAASGDVLFFTDSDCVPHPDWIETAIKHFEKQGVAVVAGSYGIANGRNLLARCVYKEILYRHQHFVPDYPRAFGSYNFGIRKNVFDELGGFDEGYRNASGEDNDLSYRVLKANYKIYFARNSFVDHFHPERLGKYLREQARHGYWRVKMYRDHPKMMQGDDYTFWKDIIEVPIIFLLVGLGIAGMVWPAGLKGVWVVFWSFFLMELVWAGIFVREIRGAFYYAFVMAARAFSRTFGFIRGFL